MITVIVKDYCLFFLIKSVAPQLIISGFTGKSNLVPRPSSARENKTGKSIFSQARRGRLRDEAMINLRQSLRTINTLGPAILFVVERLSSTGGLLASMVFFLKMFPYYNYSKCPLLKKVPLCCIVKVHRLNWISFPIYRTSWLGDHLVCERNSYS